MKSIIRTLSSATLMGLILAASNPGLKAQSTEETTTTVQSTSSAGVISEFSPKTIVIRSQSSPDPIRYTYTKTTTYVDETGAPVSMEVVKSGLPVTVYYQKIGDDMVASKVIVRKAVKVTTPSIDIAPPPAPAPVIEEKKTTTTTIEK